MKYDEYYRDLLEKTIANRSNLPLPAGPKISIIVPVYNVNEHLLTLCVESTLAQIYPAQEVILIDDCSTQADTLNCLARYEKHPLVKIFKTPKNLHISGASNFGVEKASGDFLFFLDNDDQIPHHALLEIALALNTDKKIDLLYGDENKIEIDGRFSEPYHKPDWSPEHIASVMYALHPLVIRTTLFRELKGFREEYSGAQDYDLFLRASLKARKIHHVREVIYHWRKLDGSAAAQVDAKPYALERARKALQDYFNVQGKDTVVENGMLYGTFRARHPIKGNPLISILIPTDYRTRDVHNRGLINMAVHLVKSIREKTTYPNYEVVIVDNANVTPEDRKVIEAQGGRIVHYPDQKEKFNYSNRVNFAASQAKGEYLLPLNDDMEVISPDWLQAMLEFAQQDEIGIVGARLLYPQELVQHVGVFFTKQGEPLHAMHGIGRNEPGYNSFAMLIRNYLAVTGACFMVKKKLWDEVGGLDSKFAIDFNDIDFSLKIYEKGLRIVYTPYTELYHYNQSSLVNRVQRPEERTLFFDRWRHLVYHDPYSNLPEVALEDVGRLL